MSAVQMSPTPATENSVYFDAPPINSSSTPAEQPVAHPATPGTGATAPGGPNGVHHAEFLNGISNGAHQPSPAYEASDPSAAYGDAKPLISSDAQSSSTMSPTRSASPAPTADHKRVMSGAFASGPGLSGPAATPEVDERQHARAATAESSLTPAVKAKITKEELKNSKRLSKMIKGEAKAEKKSLDVAIKELSKIQKIQKQACSDESKALSTHAKALKVEHKAHMAFLSAKQKYEAAASELHSKVERLDACKEHALRQTELLQMKNKEVEEMRAQKAVDDREREAKLKELVDGGKAA